MGFWRRLFKREEKTSVTITPMTIPDGIWSSDDAVSALTASSIAAVKRCIDVKAGAVASLGLHMFRKVRDGGRSWFEDYEGSPVDVLLSEQPNHRQNAYDFLWDIIYQREMNGNAYVVPLYRGGALSELVSVPDSQSVGYDRVRRVYTVNDGYDGIAGEFAENEIIHLKSYCRDGFLGEPVVNLAGRILSIARKTYAQQGDLFTPGSTLRGFITGDDGMMTGLGELQDDQLETVTNRIRSELSKTSHLHYLPGSMKFVSTGMTPADLQLLDSMKFLNLEICRFFGVPPTQVFQDSNVNYKSTESSQSIFLTSTLVPLLRQIENEFNIKLLTGVQRRHMRIRFNLSEYYQSDPAVQATALGSLVQHGVMTPNDARQRLGLKPLPDGDKLFIVGGKAADSDGGDEKDTDTGNSERTATKKGRRTETKKR